MSIKKDQEKMYQVKYALYRIFYHPSRFRGNLVLLRFNFFIDFLVNILAFGGWVILSKFIILILFMIKMKLRRKSNENNILESQRMFFFLPTPTKKKNGSRFDIFSTLYTIKQSTKQPRLHFVYKISFHFEKICLWD